MYAFFTIVFVLATIITRGDCKVGYAIAAGLFSIADAISYTVNKK